MSGRKPLYDIKSLEIGAKIELTGKAERFKDQYLYAFNKRSKKKYKQITDDDKVYIVRIK
jgi:hypothetical protein